jgi:hypothetical protein
MLHMSLEPNLTAALIGGGLALSGVIIGQIFTLISGRIQRRHDRDVRQRERLEKLAEAVGATLSWYTALGKCRTLEEIKLVPPAPDARKAAMLASLYFPSLAQPATDFANSLVRLHHHAIDCFALGHPVSVGASMAIVAQNNPKAKKLQDESFHLRLALDKAIIEEAKHYSHV